MCALRARGALTLRTRRKHAPPPRRARSERRLRARIDASTRSWRQLPHARRCSSSRRRPRRAAAQQAARAPARRQARLLRPPPPPLRRAPTPQPRRSSRLRRKRHLPATPPTRRSRRLRRRGLSSSSARSACGEGRRRGACHTAARAAHACGRGRARRVRPHAGAARRAPLQHAGTLARGWVAATRRASLTARARSGAGDGVAWTSPFLFTRTQERRAGASARRAAGEAAKGCAHGGGGGGRGRGCSARSAARARNSDAKATRLTYHAPACRAPSFLPPAQPTPPAATEATEATPLRRLLRRAAPRAACCRRTTWRRCGAMRRARARPAPARGRS